MRKERKSQITISRNKFHAKDMFTYVIDTHSLYNTKDLIDRIMGDKGFLPASEFSVELAKSKRKPNTNYRNRNTSTNPRLKRRNLSYWEYCKNCPVKGIIRKIVYVNTIYVKFIEDHFSIVRKEYGDGKIISSKKTNKKLKRHLTVEF